MELHNSGAGANTDNTLSINRLAFCQLAPDPFRHHPWRNLRQDVITERDYRNILATARDDGFAAGLVEGEAKGLAEGEARGKADVAKAMLSHGLSEDMILQATGLTEAELDGLKKDLH